MPSSNDPSVVRHRADPSPCPRCAHRQDVHEFIAGMRYCRLCNWIAAAYPCSLRTVGMERRLDALSFDLES